MIRPAPDLPVVYVCVAPVDFRKQIDGLAALVQAVLRLDPFSEQLYVFTNRRRNRVRILYWEGSGFVLWQKRLERERFYWPRSARDVVTLTGRELNFLLDGYDLRRWRGHQRLQYAAVV